MSVKRSEVAILIGFLAIGVLSIAAMFSVAYAAARPRPIRVRCPFTVVVVGAPAAEEQCFTLESGRCPGHEVTVSENVVRIGVAVPQQEEGK